MLFCTFGADCLGPHPCGLAPQVGGSSRWAEVSGLLLAWSTMAASQDIMLNAGALGLMWWHDLGLNPPWWPCRHGGRTQQFAFVWCSRVLAERQGPQLIGESSPCWFLPTRRLAAKRRCCNANGPLACWMWRQPPKPEIPSLSPGRVTCLYACHALFSFVVRHGCWHLRSATCLLLACPAWCATHGGKSLVASGNSFLGW